jgi:hypothetical protein
MAARRTPHFDVLNMGFLLMPPSVRLCVSEVNNAKLFYPNLWATDGQNAEKKRTYVYVGFTYVLA